MSDRINPQRRRFIQHSSALGAAALLPLAGQASAQGAAWPTKPVRLVVGFPQGSSPDVTARLLVEPLSKALGQPVTVENHPGDAGNAGANLVAKATDGHTLGYVTNGPLTSSQFLYKLPYKLSDFKPVTLLSSAPQILVCANSVNFATPQAFFTAAKEAGAKWKYGSVGVGSGGHLGMELIKSKVPGFDAVHAPQAGSPQAIAALSAGQIELAVLPLGTVAAALKAGKIKAVGITSSGRSSLAPDQPSLTELGIVGLNIEVWNSLVMPASTPPAVADRLSTELSNIIRSPEMRQKLLNVGWKAEGTSPEALSNRIRTDTLVYGGIIKTRGVKIEG